MSPQTPGSISWATPKMFASPKVGFALFGKTSPGSIFQPLPVPAFSNSKDKTPLDPINSWSYTSSKKQNSNPISKTSDQISSVSILVPVPPITGGKGHASRALIV